ncbi:hypothetical protein FKW77_004359 [Venturia effusa]|uniref:Heterokaryon incompatibility domain-containing protein n=1 Tax=Venturia effusa TaxID=50376 RepID=A0A517L952_9PEZI|nr:hypothetical protein FKW77_004359 [Venturia effusa]
MSISYEPLSRLESEIRLLTILPTSGTDRDEHIRCTLEIVSLVFPPSYTALSYCWGDPNDKGDIVVNEQRVQAGSNLIAALQQLREDNISKVWVDALCINQDDVEERNSQLLRMGAIYRRAEVTVAWLGLASDRTNDVFQSFTKILEDKERWPQPDDFGSVPQQAEAEMFALLGREYWYRVWIIQELALSKQVIVMCGSFQTTWATIEAALQMTTFRGHESLDHLRNIARLRKNIVEDKPVHIYEALYHSCHSLASEPRDKVFALLGLAYNAAAIMPIPNYAQSVPDLCLEMTLSAMAMTRSLDVILLGRVAGVESGPSWQANWLSLRLDSCSAKRIFMYLWDKLRPRFSRWFNPLSPNGNRWSASLDHLPNFQLRSHNILRAKGCLIDEITSLSSRWVEEPADDPVQDGVSIDDASPTVRVDSKELERLEGLLGRADSSLPKIDRETRTWFRRNGIFLSEAGYLEGWEDFLGFCRYFFESVEHFNSDSWRNCALRDLDMRFMLAQGKYKGWVDSDARVGDKVALLLGCTVPVILRPRVGGGYRLVGDSVIKGLMYGEGLEGVNIAELDYIESLLMT